MTSVTAPKYLGISALLSVALVHLPAAVLAQTATQDPATTGSDVTTTANDQEQDGTIDRGKMRLQLLIRLVENEQNEAELRKSRLTTEAAMLDQQLRTLKAGPSTGSQAEKRQIEVIERRLQQIDVEVAEVNARLPEINTELEDLQVRLDEANGVVRDPEPDVADNGIVVNPASQWLDSKRRVQEALVYLGGYNALIDGDFGPRTAEAIRVYQVQQNLEPTGSLTDEQETALLEEADLLRARYGMTTIEDSSAGYRISYPSGLLSEGELTDQGDRRFITRDGQAELVITSSEDTVSDFSSIYDQLLSRYEVQYRRKRDEWFVVAGLVDDGRIIYDTARLNGDRMIRAQLSYPAEWRDLWSPFAVIMFNTFESVSAGES